MPEILQSPYVQGTLAGLAIGLAGMAWVAVGGMLRRRAALKEMRTRLDTARAEMEVLRQHLHTQMQITAAGNSRQSDQLQSLQSENENLRVLVQTLQQKPDRAAPRQLEVTQRAVERMTRSAPGFAQAWQEALAAAESEVASAESGLTRFVRKVLGRGTQPAALTGDRGERTAGEEP